MIKTNAEYNETKKRLQSEQKTIEDQRSKFKAGGLTPDQVDLALSPIKSFLLQLRDDVQEYENLMRGHVKEMINLRGIGKKLIELRISKGIDQQELATRLGVDLTKVSHDEMNEYHGASIDQIQKVLDAIGIIMLTKF